MDLKGLEVKRPFTTRCQLRQPLLSFWNFGCNPFGNSPRVCVCVSACVGASPKQTMWKWTWWMLEKRFLSLALDMSIIPWNSANEVTQFQHNLFTNTHTKLPLKPVLTMSSPGNTPLKCKGFRDTAPNVHKWRHTSWYCPWGVGQRFSSMAGHFQSREESWDPTLKWKFNMGLLASWPWMEVYFDQVCKQLWLCFQNHKCIYVLSRNAGTSVFVCIFVFVCT